jgi:hypothetical protein
MTIDSARRHARGKGGTWKGRHFKASETGQASTKAQL